MYDCVIIGGGPCGVTCAIYLKQAGYTPVIIEKEIIGATLLQTSQISNVIGFIGSGEELANKLNEQVTQNNIDVIYGEATIKDGKVFINDKQLDTMTILIASGTVSRTLPMLKKPHYCALCDGSLYKSKTTLIIGSGNSAYTEALHLSNICKKVILLQYTQSKIRANKELQDRLNLIPNIEIVKYDEILDDNNNILTIQIDEHLKDIQYDGIFVSIGKIQNTNLIQSIKSFIVNNDYTVEINNVHYYNIFAGGDILDKPIRQIITASADGVAVSQQIIDYLRRI